jgi:hypothetical protein
LHQDPATEGRSNLGLVEKNPKFSFESNMNWGSEAVRKADETVGGSLPW